MPPHTIIHRIESYPWDEWTDGAIRTAVKGTDFVCSESGFWMSLYSTAKRLGMRASGEWLAPGCIRFQFLPRD